MNIFITGGSTGIGLELARQYLERGDRVAVLARDEKKWKEGPLAQNPKAHFYPGSVEDKEVVLKAVQDFCKRYGALNIMVVNAGIGNAHKTAVPNFDNGEKIFKINVLGAHYSVQAAFEQFYPQKFGHIVLISSIAGYVGLSGNASYSASKAAVHKMAQGYAIDFHQFGIGVTCVNPGFVDTPLTQKNKHAMPFMISAPDAAQRIIKGVEAKKSWIGFPLPTYAIMVFMSLLPSCLYIWLGRVMKLSFYTKKGKV